MPQEIVEDRSMVKELGYNNVISIPQLKETITEECFDVGDEDYFTSLEKFLGQHYTNGNFLKLYPKELLMYFMNSGLRNLYIIIKCNVTGNIIGHICGVLRDFCIGNMQKTFWYVNFLCVDNRYRNEEVAPFLITRFYNAIDRPAIFHTSRTIPKSVSTQTYYCRPLNIEKLIKHGYFQLPKDEELQKKYITRLKSHFHTSDNGSMLSFNKFDGDVDDFVSQLNTYNAERYLIRTLVHNKDITGILRNPHFRTYKITDANTRVVGYIDFYIVNETQMVNEILNETVKDTVRHAYIYNKYLQTVSEINVLNSLCEHLYAHNEDIDIISILSQPDNCSLKNGKFLQKYSLNTHFFNHSMVKVSTVENGLMPF